MGQETTVDIDAIRGYAAKNEKQLIAQALNSLSIFNDLTVDRNLLTEKYLNKMTVQKGVRALNTTIEKEKSKRVFTRRKITPRFGMKIINVIPEELRQTFFSEMLDPNAKREPMAQWMWLQEFAKIASEIEDNFYGASFHDDPSEFDGAATYSVGDLAYFNDIIYRCISATSAGQSPLTHAAKWEDADNEVLFDGPGTLIANEITGANLSPVTTGSFDHLSAYEAFKTQWDQIPEVHKNKKPTAYVSYDVAQDLATNVNKEFGSGQGIGNADIEEGKSFLLKNTGGRLTVKPCIWMKDSRRIIMTEKKNMVVGTNQVSDFNKIGKLVEHLHGYRSIVKFMLTFQIADLETLYVNDQT